MFTPGKDRLTTCPQPNPPKEAAAFPDTRLEGDWTKSGQRLDKDWTKSGQRLDNDQTTNGEFREHPTRKNLFIISYSGQDFPRKASHECQLQKKEPAFADSFSV
ncbi:MAG TPA: hypothetical protein VKZ68_09265 [Ohtaekwangia sp.]|nr:hypothetical protein [Ohtaekwangia sp.]